MLQSGHMTPAEKQKEFTRVLFRWHKTHYRDMPWRQTRDPYRILISEIMLQQTQVERVRLKYKEFLERFPDVMALASAPLGDVLRVWSGLGYNRRARYLHECAKKVLADYGGKFPDDADLLRKLPGIGISTSAAVRAFAFDEDEPMIDTNIRRILARVFFANQKIPSDKELFLFGQSLIPKGKGRMWNYAMLDLGATLCTARHHSDDCPMKELHGLVEDFQYKKPQKPFKHSRRFYRGQIMKLLKEAPAGLAQKELVHGLARSPYDIESIILDLKKEGLVVIRRSRVLLP
jgi:A/G-specific adenine glycosylase